jgi:MFS family permease
MPRELNLRWLRLDWLSRDGKILLATKVLRTLAFGYLSVAIPYYLGVDVLKMSDIDVGVVLTIALVGGVLFTVAGGFVANKLSRRISLTLFGLMMVVSGILLIISSNFVIILLAVFIGSIGVNATETGPFVSIEQAIIPQTTDGENRTYAFSFYNLLGYAGASFGSLLAVLPTIFREQFGFVTIDGYRALFALYALTGVALTVLYKILSRNVEVKTNNTNVGGFGLSRSRRTVAKLSGFFSLDAFGGGFVIQSVISRWFSVRYNTPLSSAGTIFFFAQLITAASFLVAGRLARKFGLLNTMVFTHFPSNLLLMGVGLAPTFWTSVGFLFSRQTLSQMDVPTRQSYTVAIIPPEERNAATSITNVCRSAAAAAPPSISGYLLSVAYLTAPFILGGAFKIMYDVAIFASFRKIKPPEEVQPDPIKDK